MTTNREMLEFAAKACGIDLGYWSETYNAFWCGEYWNPIHSSADCAAMCAKMGISARYLLRVGRVECFTDYDTIEVSYFSDHNNDREAAWRFAATMVAAKIGGMKNGNV